MPNTQHCGLRAIALCHGHGWLNGLERAGIWAGAGLLLVVILVMVVMWAHSRPHDPGPNHPANRGR